MEKGKTFSVDWNNLVGRFGFTFEFLDALQVDFGFDKG
jgi:hypothetical protein